MGKKTKSKSSKQAPSDKKHTKIVAEAAAAVAAAAAPTPTTKRQRNSDHAPQDQHKRPLPTAAAASKEVGGGTEGSDDLVFEDPFGDEFEPEELGEEQGGLESTGEDGVEGAGAPILEADAAAAGDVGAARSSTAAVGMDVDGDDARPEQEVQTKVWRAGVDELTEGEELEYDSTAYHMYHSLRPEWPCLSFDVIRDSLGANRSRFPHTVFAVAGTQADRAENNRLQV